MPNMLVRPGTNSPVPCLSSFPIITAHMYLLSLRRSISSCTLFLFAIALHAQCIGPIDGIASIPAGNWQAFSVPPSLSVERTITTTAGSNLITVTGCVAQLVGATVSGQGIPAGVSVVGGTCPDLELSATAIGTGTAVATFQFPPYGGSAPPGNAGLPSGINCSLAPALFQAAVCAGQYATYYMCPNNVYTFSMCTSELWNSTLTVTDASGTNLASGSTNYDDDGCGATDGHSQLSFTPIIAGTYRVRVLTAECTADPGLCGRLDVNVTPVQYPVNDDPQSAIELIVGTTCDWQEANLANATTSGPTTPNIPTNCGPAPCSAGSGLFSGRDVWFRVTVPLSGRVEVRTEMIDGANMAMAAYDGPLDDLFQLFGPTFCNSCNDDASEGNAAPYLYFPVLQPGTPLYIRVWPRGGSPLSTDFRICVTDPQPPTNDRPCTPFELTVNENCEPLPLSTLFATGSNPGITLSPNTPTCAPTSTADVWTRVVMPAAPAIRVEAQHGTVDSLALVAYSLGSGNVCATATLTEVTCATSTSLNAPPALILTGAPGTIHWLRTYALDGAPGTFSLCATALDPPVNDEPCGALPLTVVNGCLPQRFSTTYAGTSGTTSPGAINIPAPAAPCANGAPENDVWFTAVVPDNGELRLEMEPSTLNDAALAVYTAVGSCTEGTLSLTQWDCSTAGSSYGADMPLVVASGLEPGSTVYVRVWRESGAQGDVLLCAGSTSAPTGSCRYRVELTAASGSGWNGGELIVCLQAQGEPTPTCTPYTLVGGSGQFLFGANTGDQLWMTLENGTPFPSDGGLRVTSLGTTTTLLDLIGLNVTGGQLFNFLVTGTCVPPASAADCAGALTLCEDGTVSVDPSAINLIDELDQDNAGCLTDLQVEGRWYSITTYGAGTLALTMLPVDPQADLNWAIWGPFTEEERCDLDAPPVRCSNADRTGPTGMLVTADDNTEDASGDGWVKPIQSIPFRTYTLFVQSDGTIDASFDLTFQNAPANLVNCEGLPTGITHEDGSIGALQLMPNPAHDRITLTGTDLPLVRSWEVLDPRGAILMSGAQRQGGITIDVSMLSTGVYLLRTVTENGTNRQFRWLKQ